MKKRYIVFSIYFILLALVCLTTGVLAKYITSKDDDLDFIVGSTLYFNYERSNLYLNNQVVSPDESFYTEGDVEYKVLEIVDVVPGDIISYNYYVSNFNLITGEENFVDGYLFPNTNVTLSLPIKGEIYEADCTILYRQVPYGAEDTTTPTDNVWNNLVEGSYLDLPNVRTQKIKYEFKVTVVIDDQVANTTHDDYFNAVLSLKLFINAASK